MSNVFPVGITVPLNLLITANGTGIIGQTPGLILQRLSDGAFWDGVNSFSLSEVLVPMVEIDPVNRPGLYTKTFDDTIDNEENTMTVYYKNIGVYAGAASDELVFSFINSQVNPIAIAQAVQAQIYTNPQGKINPDDVASQTTLSNVLNVVDNISNVMALESTLLSYGDTIINDLNTIIGIIQPISGSNQVTFNVLDQNSNPVPSVQLTLKNTTSQITLAVAITDINGQVTLGLPSGTYNILPFRPFYSFGTLPIQIIVTTNQTFTINANSFQPTGPTANLCSLFSYILDATGQPVPGVNVRMKVITNYPFSGGSSSLLTKDWAQAESDGTGFWSLNAVIGSTIEISIPDLYISISEFIVPNQPSLDISTLLDRNN